MKRWLAAFALLALAACSSAPKKPHAAGKPGASHHRPAGATPGIPDDCPPYTPAQEDPSTRGDYTPGGLYKPGVPDRRPDHVPRVECIPEPVVTDEPRSPVGNRSPYTVLGKVYHVLDRPDGYVEQGIASYYGTKFHGRRTSNQEVYDMYAFTAAHKTLPLPSFARVTNLENGRSVVVRVNDRGPFHDGRVIDLSYAAAVKLGMVDRGTARVEVRALTPRDVDKAPRQAARAPEPATTAPATPATPMDQLVQTLPPTPAPAAAPAAPAATPVASTSATPATAATAGGGVLLQVASFSQADNARRALERLLAAGIAGARLDGVQSGGRTLWRLRVPTSGAEAAELAARISSLGFGTPQPVRE